MRILVVEPEPVRTPSAAPRCSTALGDVDYVRLRRPGRRSSTPWRRARTTPLFVRLGVAVDVAALENAPALRWVVTPTTGLDHIDLDEAAPPGRRGGLAPRRDRVPRRRHPDGRAHLGVAARRAPATRRRPRRCRRRTVAATIRSWVSELARRRRSGSSATGGSAGWWRDTASPSGWLVLVHDPTTTVARSRRVSAGGTRRPARPLRRRHAPPAPRRHDPRVPARGTGSQPCGRARCSSTRPAASWSTRPRSSTRSSAAASPAPPSTCSPATAAGTRVVPADHPLVRYARSHDNLVLTPHIGGYARHAHRANPPLRVPEARRSRRDRGSTTS